ncbi:MAG: hypothetical protein U0230_16315 [Polyangiales bacterium]
MLASRLPLILALLSVWLLGCSREAASDPRFRTPEATIHTLFEAYDVADVPEDQIRQRLAAHAQFQLRDAETYRRCFADFRDPSDEGLAGFVFGRLVSFKDHLRYETHEDRAVVTLPVPRGTPGARIVLVRESGAFRIVLADSVPREVAVQLREIHRRARANLERTGVIEGEGR